MTIKQAQKELHKFIKFKGWDKQPLSVDIAFLAEETGEVAREALYLEVPRKDKKIKKQAIKDLGYELSDVFYWVLKIASRLDIDLEKVFIEKFEKIKKRK